MSYLSHQDQNKLADMVFEHLEPLARSFNRSEKGGAENISLTDLATADGSLTAVFKLVANNDYAIAKKLLTRLVWEELAEMTDAFQRDDEREHDEIELVAYLKEVQNLMEKLLVLIKVSVNRLRKNLIFG